MPGKLPPHRVEAGVDPLPDRVRAAPLSEPRAYRPCHKPAGAIAIVAMQPIHPKEQVSSRRLRDAERLPAERGSQFGFERLAVRAGHRGRHPSPGRKRRV
jgi:hypothetical protein